jgi:uncharacterized protein
VKTILWQSEDSPSLEYFRFIPQSDGFVLHGDIILFLEGQPTRVTYQVGCDAQWRTNHVMIHQERSGTVEQLPLGVSDEQTWHQSGNEVSLARGLYDVDLEITPATNILPIRRLNLKEGESRETAALWVRFPSLTLERLEQRYTRISPNLYHYESPSIGFETQLEVDEDGLIVRYHGLWRRLST